MLLTYYYGTRLPLQLRIAEVVERHVRLREPLLDVGLGQLQIELAHHVWEGAAEQLDLTVQQRRHVALAHGDHIGGAQPLVEEASVARKVAELRQFKLRSESLSAGSRMTLEDLHARILEGEKVKLPVVLKADTQGSVQTLSDALSQLSTDSVQVEMMHAAVGGVTETDVLLAAASDAIIVGFNVRPERDVAAATLRLAGRGDADAQRRE